MGTISVTWPSDGDTIDAADISTPGNTIVTAINGNLDSNNVTAGGLTPANLVSGTGTSWAWQSWTPTLTVIGGTAPTLDCKYVQIGKTVFCRIAITFVAGTTMGSGLPTLTLPVTAATHNATTYLGQVRYNTTVNAQGFIRYATTTTVDMISCLASGTYLQEDGLSATVPGTWANTHKIVGTFVYEAA